MTTCLEIKMPHVLFRLFILSGLDSDLGEEGSLKPFRNLVDKMRIKIEIKDEK